jgi:hypothetical protein
MVTTIVVHQTQTGTSTNYSSGQLDGADTNRLRAGRATACSGGLFRPLVIPRTGTNDAGTARPIPAGVRDDDVVAKEYSPPAAILSDRARARRIGRHRIAT